MENYIVGTALYERLDDDKLICVDFRTIPINENLPIKVILCPNDEHGNLLHFVAHELFPNSKSFPDPVHHDVYLQAFGSKEPFDECQTEFYKLIERAPFTDADHNLCYQYSGVGTRFRNVAKPNTTDVVTIDKMERRFMEQVHKARKVDHNKEEKEMINCKPLRTTGLKASDIAVKANIHYLPIPGISKIIFNDPATIVFWTDGKKTVVKCMEGQEFNEYYGVACAIMKRFFGNNSKASAFVEKFKEEEE